MSVQFPLLIYFIISILLFYPFFGSYVMHMLCPFCKQILFSTIGLFASNNVLCHCIVILLSHLCCCCQCKCFLSIQFIVCLIRHFPQFAFQHCLLKQCFKTTSTLFFALLSFLIASCHFLVILSVHKVVFCSHNLQMLCVRLKKFY